MTLKKSFIIFLFFFLFFFFCSNYSITSIARFQNLVNGRL